MPLADADDDFFLFPVEEIVQYPLPGYVAPSSISFSLDGSLSSYYFSPDGTLHRKVFAFDVASRWEELEVCGTEPELKLPSCPGSPITDPHLSSDGSMLADVKDDELHVLSLSQGKPKQLTIGARTSGKVRYMLLV
ncbi:unnamed protein product [Musa hybrid cultivar]